MADLSTRYMGIELRSPVIAGAGILSRNVDNIKAVEDAGAGALVIHSLFQEQIELERQELDEALRIGADQFPEALTYFPQLEHAGPREHVMWVEKTRRKVKMPLLGSLNANSLGNWTDYARQLESAGCDGLELNIYSVETDPARASADIEQRSLEIIAAVKSSVGIPVSVKLGPWYTSVANFASEAARAGADGLVLFNRFYQPGIDPEREALRLDLPLSTSAELRLPLRWTAVLSDAVSADIAGSTGVHSGADAVSLILAGAKAVQTVSSLVINGPGHVRRLNTEISEWMDRRGYARVEDFRGKLSQKRISDPYGFERAQYVKLLMDPGKALGQ